MIRVRTTVIDKYFDASTEVDVDDFLFRKATHPLDLPNPNAPAAATTFCTDLATIKMVMNDRNVLAKKISDAITWQLLNFMSQHDTVMGYKILQTQSDEAPIEAKSGK